MQTTEARLAQNHAEFQALLDRMETSINAGDFNAAISYARVAATLAWQRSCGIFASPRLESLLERLVETPVRGFVYEGAGTVDARLLAGGAELVRNAERTWRIPAMVTETPRSDGPAWVEELETGVVEILARR